MKLKMLSSAVFVVATSSITVSTQTALSPPTTPEVAPGIHIPYTATLSALDQISGVPKLVTLHATEISLNHHAGSNYARAQVLGNQHRTVDVEGPAASQIIESRQPSFYFHLPQDHPEIARSQLTLIRLKPQKDRRVVLDLSNNAFGGGLKRNVDVVTVNKTDLEGGFVKITPTSELGAGEYAFMFLPKDPSLFDELIYDFSIDSGPAKRLGN